MMKMRIGISQRVEDVASYKERRDCLDQKWSVLLEELELIAVPIPNSLMNINNWLENQQLKGFILTGGNDISDLPDASNPAPERDNTEKTILNYATKENLPVLGVCRGLQLMNIYLEGELIPVTNHVATRHNVKAIDPDSLFSHYKSTNSFHDWGMKHSQLSEALVPSVISESDGTIEAVRHKTFSWTGIMWHPEREDPFNKIDKRLIQKTFDIK